MLWLLSQDLPVKLLGFPQPAGAMVLHRQIEGLWDRELGHERLSRSNGNLV
jgi:hypothetical protein